MAELKIKADSGGGTVSLKGPATTNSNAAVNVTLPKASIDLTGGSNGQYLKTDGAGTLSWGTVSTDPTTTSGTNNFTVADGNLVIGTAGHGIDFSATSDDGTLAGAQELLDDYEEGYFTATAANSVTFNNFSTLNYTKVGNLVHIFGILNIDSDNSNSVFYINNLPFAHGGTSPQYSVPAVHTNNWDMPANAINISGYGTSSQLRLRVDIDNGSPAQVNADSGAELFVSYTYRST